MQIKRVVASHDKAGKSIIASTDHIEQNKAVHLPGFASALIWATEPNPSVPDKSASWRATATSFHPEPGGSRLLVVTFPPDAVAMSPSFDPVAAGNEQLTLSPGIAERFEPDNPGMHFTDSIDYGIVLTGEIWLEVDDGKDVHLKPHDIVVQNGGRHAWRNKTNSPTTMAFVLIGADRKG
jgi:hypothetical protein